jgi:hypothetical protein
MPERRRYTRQRDRRPAKVRRGLDQRYFPAETVDRSAGGVLLKLTQPTNLQPGQRIELGLPEPGQAVIASHKLQRARVVRRLGKEAETYIALAFEHAPAQALAAAG